MKTMLDLRRCHYLARISTFLIVIALIAGMVGCAPPAEEEEEEEETYDLTIESSAGGSVTATVNEEDTVIGAGETETISDIPADTEVDLVAEAEEGHRFVNWTGDVSTDADVDDPTTTITMEDDYSITANFGVNPMVADFGGPYVSSNDPTLGAYVAVEGFALTLDASASYYPDGTIVLYEWDVDNDGTYDLAVDTPTTLYTYGDDYEGPIVLRVTDSEGLTATDTGFIMCLNEPPVVDFGSVTATVGTAVEFHARFYDPGNDDFSYSWDFGDGTAPLSGTVTGEPAGLHLLSVSHTYGVEGWTWVTLTISDDRNTSVGKAVVEVVSGGGASSLTLRSPLTTAQGAAQPSAQPFGLQLTETPEGWLPGYDGHVNHHAQIVSPVPARIYFNLSSSNEPGYCMNYPQPVQSKKWQPGPDLRFVQEDQIDPNIEVLSPDSAWTIEPVFGAYITTSCYDYGSYGYLSAMTLDPLMGAAVNIPLDTNGNNIADGWEFDRGAARDDLDANPAGDGTPGDGFSRYEEYRGFMVGGGYGYIRTSPNDKDLFIRDQDGINLRGDVAQLDVQVHWINNDEWQNGFTRIVNYNSGFASVMDQRALRLQDGNFHREWWGATWGPAGGPGLGNWVPNTVDPCRVYTGNISNSWPPPGGTPTADEVITRTVAHELAHGVDIRDNFVAQPPARPLFIMTEHLPAGWAVGHTFRPGAGNGTLSELRLVLF